MNTRMKSTLVIFLSLALSHQAQAKPVQFNPNSWCEREDQLKQIDSLEEFPTKDLLEAKIFPDQIVVSKNTKELFLLKGNKLLRRYAVAFGGVPKGHKQFQGDEKTPEGSYLISLKNPQSAFYLSLKVNYPNAADIAWAKAKGKSAGGDIFIHGFPKAKVGTDWDARFFQARRKGIINVHPVEDWTLGCIAVTDEEIYEIYQLVRVQTPIDICSKTR